MSVTFGPPPGQQQQQQVAPDLNTTSPNISATQPMQTAPTPETEQKQQGLPEFKPLEIPQQNLIDPFYQSQLGQLLRGISSGYDRSPYGQGQTVGQYIPGVPMYGMMGGGQQQQQQQGGGLADILSGLGFMKGAPQAQMIRAETPGQYLGPVGPTEWTFRSGMTNQMMNQMPGMGRWNPSIGPFAQAPMEQYLAQQRRTSRYGGGQNQSIPAMQPERYDPSQGIYWWY